VASHVGLQKIEVAGKIVKMKTSVTELVTHAEIQFAGTIIIPDSGK
jgi:hypothetical protein